MRALLENKKVVALLNFVFGGGAILVLVAKIARLHVALAQHAGPDPYKFFYSTTWLVDYSAGYVRRGFCGTIVRWLYLHFGIPPQWLITCAALIFFAALIIIAYHAFWRRNLCWWPLALTVCLGGFEMADRDGLTALLCISSFWFIGNVKNVVLRYFLVDLVGVLAIHIHEMSFFAMMPMLCLLASFDDELRCKSLFRPVVLIPILLAFGSVALNKGSLEMAKQVSANWHAILPAWWNGVELRGVRWDIGTGVAHLLDISRYNMLTMWHHIPQWMLFFGEFMATLIVVSRVPFFNRQDRIIGIVLPCLLLTQFCSILIVFPVFCDYSRLFGYWTFPVLMCFVLVPQGKWLAIYGACDNWRIFRVLWGGAKISRLVPTWIVVVLALFVGMSEIDFSPNLSLRRSIVGQYFCALVWDVYRSNGNFQVWWLRQADRN